MLAKLYARADQRAPLAALLRAPHAALRAELEPVLRATCQHRALCVLYAQDGDEHGLLRVWSR